MRRLPRFTYMRKWCEQICHIHGTHSIYTFENKSSFSIFENESQFSLENISADYPGSSFQTFVKNTVLPIQYSSSLKTV